MPFTPYHAGPSGFIGLLFRRWIDVPIFLLANVLIDIEVIADHYVSPGWPVHQLWHFHTLLIGGLAGGLFGAAIYYIHPLRRLCELSMKWIGLPCRPTAAGMIAAGIFGAWLHVVIDSFYHYDVQIFWPYARNPIHAWMRQAYSFSQTRLQHDIEIICLVFAGLLIGLYTFLLIKKRLK